LFREPSASPIIETPRTRPEADRARKLIASDEDMFTKRSQLGRDRMATIQELADEAFDDVLKKHGIPRDLKDALGKSAAPPRTAARGAARARKRKAIS
jgi:hypothetical protein